MSVNDFDFNMARAITEQLVEQFDAMEPGALTLEATASARPEPGVYLLFFDGDLVYVGKSDGDLKDRLERHRQTLTGRLNISIDRIRFKALHIHPNWSALTTESSLIRHYGRTAWNTSGFGSNDPGRNRDHTAVSPNSFDGQYPIDPDFALDIEPGTYKASDLLLKLKSTLPYLLRYEQLGDDDGIVTIAASPVTARQTLRLIGATIGNHWQITVLPGRIIVYREQSIYVHGEIIWPSNN